MNTENQLHSRLVISQLHFISAPVKMWTCNLNEDEFFKLYDPSQSGGQPFYQANLRRQRGNGIGGIFGTIGRFLLPLVKKYILPTAASTARNIAQDVLAGRNVGQAIKAHGWDGLKTAGNEFISDVAQGNLPQS